MAIVLFVKPYHHLFPPIGGGQLRSFHLLEELSRQHEIHAVILQPKEELRGVVDGYEFPANVKVYNPVPQPAPASGVARHFRRVKRAIYSRWLERSWRGPANSLLLEAHVPIRNILRQNKIEVAIVENLHALPVAPLIHRESPQTTRVLLTYNVDHILLRQEKQPEKLIQQAHRQETHLARFVDAYLTCSDDDREVFARLNDPACRGFTVPNGVDTARKPFDASPEKSAGKRILFCGVLTTEANQDGLLWFYREIWPVIVRREPEAKLIIVGAGKSRDEVLAIGRNPRIEFVGEVKDLIPHYRSTGISVVPLRIGSGTRLKILEAMSLGNPVVSTTLGAEGIKAVNNEHLLLADTPQNFAEAVLKLMADRELFDRLRHSARRLVTEHYDWRVIGENLNNIVQSLAHAHRG